MMDFTKCKILLKNIGYSDILIFLNYAVAYYRYIFTNKYISAIRERERAYTTISLAKDRCVL